jgi:hypothetical protein
MIKIFPIIGMRISNWLNIFLELNDWLSHKPLRIVMQIMWMFNSCEQILT